jgi:hypothetical protein
MRPVFLLVKIRVRFDGTERTATTTSAYEPRLTAGGTSTSIKHPWTRVPHSPIQMRQAKYACTGVDTAIANGMDACVPMIRHHVRAP